MKTIYILKLVNSKNINKLIKYHIHFIKIKYVGDTCFLYVDKNNYQKLTKYFKMYDISLYQIEGFLKYQLLLKKYYFFIISMVVGICFTYLLSNIIFDVKIMTNKNELIRILNNELDEAGLVKYHFAKSYEEKEKLKEKILSEYKDKFEWIEIERVGTRYYIRVLERIINNKDVVKYQNVVAKRNAIILEIKAQSGQIIKKVNDYVNKGDVIISGNITKGEDIKAQVQAEGQIYGETWYTVRVELPRSYKQTIYTGNNYTRLSLDIFNHKIFLLGHGKYENEEIEDSVILESKILPLKFNKTKIYEAKETSFIYTYDDVLNKALSIARKKLTDNLLKDSKILEQKKLKLYEENSTIIIEVFFRVYENITDYEELEEGE